MIHELVQEGSVIFWNNLEWTIVSFFGDTAMLQHKTPLGEEVNMSVPYEQLIELQIVRKTLEGLDPKQLPN
jgi:hypothetical protein